MKNQNIAELDLQLVLAISSLNYDLALDLIDKGAFLNSTEFSWFMPLSQAIIMASDEKGIGFVHKLISLGAEINPSNSGTTPLASAIQVNHDGSRDNLIDFLIERGAQINPKSDSINTTPLIVALQSNNKVMVDKLLSLGADVNPSNASLTSTPLITVMQSANAPELLSVIFEKTDFSKKLPAKCIDGYLMTCFRLGREDLMEKLLAIEGIDINSAGGGGDTPLYLSIVQNRPFVAKKLLEMGARLEAQTTITTTNPQLIDLVKSYQPEASIAMFSAWNMWSNFSTFSEPICNSIQPQQEYVQIVEQQVIELDNVQKLNNALRDKDIMKIKEIVEQEGASIINNNAILFGALDNIIVRDQNYSKSIEILDYLLNVKGVDPNVVNYGISILQQAFFIKNQVIVDKLIELGATALVLDNNYHLDYNNEIFVDYVHKNSSKVSDLIKTLNQNELDSKAVVEKLKSIIADGHRPTLQAAVTKGGQDLIKAINDVGEFKQIKKDFTKYGVKYSAKYHADSHDFIIASTFHQNESDKLPANNHEVKEKSKTFFESGKIYSSLTGQILDEINSACYVISKTGKLYTTINGSNLGHHSFFLKGKPGDELFGFGKPVACGGHITIKNGKITEFSGSSGYYGPTVDQIKVVAHYLKEQGVFSEGNKIEWYDQNAGHGLFNDITLEAVGQVLDQYALVEY